MRSRTLMELVVTRVLEQFSQECGSIIIGTTSINLVSMYKHMRNMTTQWPQEQLVHWPCYQQEMGKEVSNF